MIKVSCCIPGKLPVESGYVPQNQYEKLLFGYQYLISLGFDTVETSVGFVLDLTDDERKQLAADRAAGRFELDVCNCLLPSHLPIITDEAGEKALYAYLDDTIPKLAELGVKKLVFGSGRARSFPEGRDREECLAALNKFFAYCNELYGRYGITMTLEPLNSGETNWVRTISEGAAIVRSLNLPNIRLLADGYHMGREKEDPSVLRDVADILVHTHLAEPEKRHFPGTYGGEYESRFIKTLKKIGYDGILCCECGARNFHEDAKASVEFIKKILAE